MILDKTMPPTHRALGIGLSIGPFYAPLDRSDRCPSYALLSLGFS